MTISADKLDHKFPGSVSIDDPTFLDGFNVKPLLDAIVSALNGELSAADKAPVTAVVGCPQRTTSTESADYAGARDGSDGQENARHPASGYTRKERIAYESNRK